VTAETEIARVEAALDEFHAAAAGADSARYFAVLAPDAVFLGTAGDERWAGEQFRAFVDSYFSRGKGWTYEPHERSVTLAEDGKTAWFDERLENESYGRCRGTGVLRLRDGAWKIEQYNLTIPIPNDMAADVVARIRNRAEPPTSPSR
jgi:ketosteroid isomerase-like protein